MKWCWNRFWIWSLLFLFNLIVPFLFFLEFRGIFGAMGIGIGLALALLWLSGTVFTQIPGTFRNVFLLGFGEVAISQVFPILQGFCLYLAMRLGSIIGFSIYDPRLHLEISSFLTFLLAGQIHFVLSFVIGFLTARFLALLKTSGPYFDFSPPRDRADTESGDHTLPA